jgi:hypothetical protein
MMDLFATHTWVLAQEGSEAAVNVIENALQLTQSTIESWNDTWAQTITPSSALWVDIVDFSRGLLALTFLYMFIRFGSEVMKSRYIGTVVELFTFPLIVLLFLGGDGRLLSNIILFIRSLGYTLVTGLLNQQLLGYTLEGAVKQFGLNNLGVQRIKQLYAECEGLVGDPFQQCWNSKGPEAQAIYDNLQAQNGDIDFGPLESFVTVLSDFTIAGGIDSIGDAVSGFRDGGINGAFVSVIQDRLIPLIQSVLYAVQWAFVNLVEAALLIAAVLAPIALVLSILPVAGRPIWAWASGIHWPDGIANWLQPHRRHCRRRSGQHRRGSPRNLPKPGLPHVHLNLCTGSGFRVLPPGAPPPSIPPLAAVPMALHRP